MLIIPIDKSTNTFIFAFIKQLFSQWSLKRQLIIYKEYLVLGKLRTIQATGVHFQNRGIGESSHQSGFIQKTGAIFQGFFKNHIRFSRTTY